MQEILCTNCLQMMFPSIIHTCPPCWTVSLADDYQNVGPQRIFAHTPEFAAEAFCDGLDQDSELDLINAGAATVIVTDPKGQVILVRIEITTVPIFTASLA